jgi:predicted DNA-binding transcriptional regulator YafY
MRADRLITLMLLLNARGQMTANQLAAELEVSERTIYRDLEALSGAGVPVCTQSGVNGGVQLDAHYRVTLNGLSREEAQALFISNDLQPLRDLGLGSANTLLKLIAGLPGHHRSDVERMQGRFHIDTANWFQVVEPQPFLPLLQKAIWEDLRVIISYQAVQDEPRTRLLEAYGLVAKANIWYLVAKKPETTLDTMHSYRLSRFLSVELADSTFNRDANFDLAAYWRDACARFEESAHYFNPPYTVRLRVDACMAWYFTAYMEGHYQKISMGEGWTTLSAAFDSCEEARRRLLGLGTHVEILEPAELRRGMIAMAAEILAQYGTAQADE